MGSTQLTLQFRVKPGRFGEIVFCACGISQRESGPSTIAVGRGVLWVEFNRLVEVRDGAHMIAQVILGDAAIVVGWGVL